LGCGSGPRRRARLLLREQIGAALAREVAQDAVDDVEVGEDRDDPQFDTASGALLPDDTQLLEHLARYLCRAPLRQDNVREQAQRVVVRTPPDPVTGATELKLDPHELIRRLCEQIPSPKQHQVRYFGRYSNRSRGTRRLQAERTERATCAHARQEEDGLAPHGTGGTPSSPPSQAGRDPALDSPAARARRRSWGRMLRHIYEVDPLLCPRCQAQLRIVAVICDLDIVDRIQRHIARTGAADLFEPQASRAPPAV
jgi:hypothetical protein